MRFFLPLRVGISSGLVLRRRVSPRQGESLSFVAPNESNQSKGALHLAELRGYKLRRVKAVLRTGRTPAAISPPLGSLRIAARKRSRALRADAKRGVTDSPSDELSSTGLCGARAARINH